MAGQLMVEVTITEDCAIGKKGVKKQMEISTARAVKKTTKAISFEEPKELVPMDVKTEGVGGVKSPASTIGTNSGGNK